MINFIEKSIFSLHFKEGKYPFGYPGLGFVDYE